MALDRTSEMIAHFIGVFETAQDKARFREEGDGFRYAPDRDEEYEGLMPKTLLLRAPHDLGDYDSAISSFRFPALPTPGLPGDGYIGGLGGLPASQISASLDLRVYIQIGGPGDPGEIHFYFIPPPPAAFAVVSYQMNVLEDHDLMLSAEGIYEFYTMASLDARLAEVASTAELTPPPEDPDASPFSWGVTKVEADLVCVNWVQQYNYITDHDRAEITFSGEDTYLAFGDNTSLNLTNILEFAHGYDLIIIGGQYIDMTLIAQVNVLLDDDFVTYNGDWPATISMDDNLLLNGANVENLGADTFIALPDEFAAAGASLGDGGANISAALAQSDWFSGHELLSVLYIEGDLINVNSIEQTNIVGDADQIRVELEALEDRVHEADVPLTVTTGSNAVVNLASVLEYGIDSTIMVGGDVYDELLLYQANLIDTDADPTGVAHTPLATEAVAFLADDMIADADISDLQSITPAEAEISSPDVMQTVLA